MFTAQLTQNKQQKGFTLIELLVVIGILAILLAIVLIAINPARQFGQANDTRRKSDVAAILNAIGAYAADNAGNMPPGMPAKGAAAVDANSVCSGVVPTYIAALPADPSLSYQSVSSCTAPVNPTSYMISQDANGRVTVSATGTSGTISVTR